MHYLPNAARAALFSGALLAASAASAGHPTSTYTTDAVALVDGNASFGAFDTSKGMLLNATVNYNFTVSLSGYFTADTSIFGSTYDTGIYVSFAGLGDAGYIDAYLPLSGEGVGYHEPTNIQFQGAYSIYGDGSAVDVALGKADVIDYADSDFSRLSVHDPVGIMSITYEYDPAAAPPPIDPTPGDDTSAVPEPASWAMMIAGFGMIGSTMRRRRTTAIRFA